VLAQAQEIGMELLQTGAGATARDEGGALGVLGDIAEDRADDGAVLVEVIELEAAPGVELAIGVAGLAGEAAGTGQATAIEDCLDERLLGPEVAEERDFVDAGLLRDAAGGSAAVAGSGVDLRGGVEEFVAEVQGAGELAGAQREASTH
jgi:hypothetical protein